MDINNVIAILQGSVRVATPILFAALAGCLSEQAGIYAMGLEGFMLIGAFVSIVAALLTQSLIIGLLAGVLAGGLVATIFAYVTIKVGADQVLGGLAINMFVLGATGFLMRLVWGMSGIPMTPEILIWQVPVLSSIPIIGPVFFNQPPLTYLAYLMVPAVWWFMFKSHWGLELRAVGEKPRAVDTVGISVVRTRFMAVILSGFLAGLGGAVLSLQQVNTFTENMTAGRGWLALISAISGGWNPIWAAATSFLFGIANALQLRIQVMGLDISSWIVLMVPYILAILLVAIVGKAARHPEATGVQYIKE
jgi:general nucleoside transport system permease protein